MSHVPTVLVTGASGPAGRSLGRQLAERASAGTPIRAIGVDLTDNPVAGFDEVVAVAPAADLAYAPTMVEAARHWAPDLIIPTVQDELSQIAVLADALVRAAAGQEGGQSRVVDAGALASALAADKLLTMWTLEAAGVPIPHYASAEQFGSTAEAIAWAGGPVVVKPRVSRGGRGVQLVEQPADLDWSQVGSGQVVQGFAPGEEFAPQTYRSPHDGSVHAHVLRKTALKEGRVGNAAEAVRVPDGSFPEIVQIAVSAVRALGLVGPVDMDVRLDQFGEPVVLEVNGRFGALSALAPELLTAVLEDYLRP